jgi:hypothetical protein
VASRVPLDLKETDVDSSAELKKEFGDQVPLLFIDGRKAFKYKVTIKQLERRLRRSGLWARLRLARRGGG